MSTESDPNSDTATRGQQGPADQHAAPRMSSGELLSRRRTILAAHQFRGGVLQCRQGCVREACGSFTALNKVSNQTVHQEQCLWVTKRVCKRRRPSNKEIAKHDGIIAPRRFSCGSFVTRCTVETRVTLVNLLPIPEVAEAAAASFESFQQPFAGPHRVSAAEKTTQFGGFLRFLFYVAPPAEDGSALGMLLPHA